MSDRKLVDEVHHISKRRGNGQLRREVWIDDDGKVSRYNLAYINHELCAVDNGRVVGYAKAQRVPLPKFEMFFGLHRNNSLRLSITFPPLWISTSFHLHCHRHFTCSNGHAGQYP